MNCCDQIDPCKIIELLLLRHVIKLMCSFLNIFLGTEKGRREEITKQLNEEYLSLVQSDLTLEGAYKYLVVNKSNRLLAQFHYQKKLKSLRSSRLQKV